MQEPTLSAEPPLDAEAQGCKRAVTGEQRPQLVSEVVHGSKHIVAFVVVGGETGWIIDAAALSDNVV